MLMFCINDSFDVGLPVNHDLYYDSFSGKAIHFGIALAYQWY